LICGPAVAQEEILQHISETQYRVFLKKFTRKVEILGRSYPFSIPVRSNVLTWRFTRGGLSKFCSGILFLSFKPNLINSRFIVVNAPWQESSRKYGEYQEKIDGESRWLEV
jgi:hypothetical protein